MLLQPTLLQLQLIHGLLLLVLLVPPLISTQESHATIAVLLLQPLLLAGVVLLLHFVQLQLRPPCVQRWDSESSACLEVERLVLATSVVRLERLAPPVRTREALKPSLHAGARYGVQGQANKHQVRVYERTEA